MAKNLPTGLAATYRVGEMEIGDDGEEYVVIMTEDKVKKWVKNKKTSRKGSWTKPHHNLLNFHMYTQLSLFCPHEQATVYLHYRVFYIFYF
jgi:hypothetical protein